MKRILILMSEAKDRAVLEVVVLGHGCGVTTCRKFFTSSNQRFRLRFSQPNKRETVRLEEESVPSPSLPGSHEAIDHVSRWDTEGLGNPTRY